MQVYNIRRAFSAGLVATIAMTALMYLAPMMGMPKMDIAAMLGSFLTNSPAAPASAAWGLGMLVHFIMGTFVLPFIYVSTVANRLQSKPWMKGLIFGLALWALSQVAVMPLMGAGFFSVKTAAPAMMLIGNLIGHIIYGLILGSTIGEPIVARTKTPEMTESQEEITLH